MTEFTATHFRFEVQALTPLAFEAYTGSALRGALVGALQRNFCPVRDQGDPTHQAICPVCWLLHYDATEGDSRRPYAIEPLLGTRRIFQPGERFQFGLTLFGQAVNLFPYLVLAVPQIGAGGIGRKQPDDRGRWQRGRFKLCRIEEVNPLSGERLTLMGEGEQMVQTPRQPVTASQVDESVQQVLEQLTLAGDSEPGISIHFLTPTRIVDQKKLVHTPEFRPLFQRLLERVHELQRTFGASEPQIDWHGLLALAGEVELVEDRTIWWDLQGHSSRLQRPQQIGGYIGQAAYRTGSETWEMLLPWLVWGVSTHVGKNAVKGSGWYSLAVTGNR